MDHYEAEKVYINYDLDTSSKSQIPSAIAFDSGLAYPSNHLAVSAYRIEFFLNDYKTRCQYCGQPVRAAQNAVSGRFAPRS